MIITFLVLVILSLHLKPSCHSKRKLKRLKENNLKVKRKTVLIVIFNPLNHYLQEGIPNAKESTKLKFL